jgi:hypothetical protein
MLFRKIIVVHFYNHMKLINTISGKIQSSNIKVGDPYNFYCALKCINTQNK